MKLGFLTKRNFSVETDFAMVLDNWHTRATTVEKRIIGSTIYVFVFVVIILNVKATSKH